MDPDPLPYLFLLLGPLLFALFTASEIAIASINRHDIECRLKSQDKRATTVSYLIDNAPQFLLTTALVRALGVLMVSSAAVYLLVPNISGYWLSAILLLIWISMAALRAFVRAKIVLEPEPYAFRFATLARVGIAVLSPLTFALRNIYRTILRNHNEPLFEDILLSQDGLRLLMGAQRDENHIEESEKQMIASILELDETFAREIMTPRIDMVTLSVDTSLNDALDVIIGEGHSRIPVYQDNIDNIVGLLYAKDLLQCYREQQHDANLRELFRPAYFVPGSKKVNTLFQEMRTDKVHIAIVVDEYGGTAGLITIEDLLEQIVGAIQDEYDEDEELLVQVVKSGTYVMNSRLAVDDLEKLLDLTVDELDVDTLGGLIYILTGHLPEPGEVMEYEGWRFTVISVSGHRIEQVRVEKLPTSASIVLTTTNEIASQSSSVLNY